MRRALSWLAPVLERRIATLPLVGSTLASVLGLLATSAIAPAVLAQQRSPFVASGRVLALEWKAYSKPRKVPVAGREAWRQAGAATRRLDWESLRSTLLVFPIGNPKVTLP